MLKAALITDIHAGPDVYDRRGLQIKAGSHVPRILSDFVKVVNKQDVDCVIDLGDRISAQDTLTDTFNLAAVNGFYASLQKPLYYIPGNHEYKHLNAQDIENITGQPTKTWSDEIGGVHIIFWNPTVNNSWPLKISNQDLQDLETQLSIRPDTPTVVCSHIPLDNNSEDRLIKLKAQGKPEDHGQYGYYYYVNAHEARKIMEDHGNVILCVAGHRHQTRLKTINGIRHLNLDSPIAMRKNARYIPDTHARLTVDPASGDVHIDIRGKNARTYDFSF